ncbi:MAG: DUF2169 domain-containing protein [Polyangiaceae bacterium]|nr:DUF2169 domain-containing protein [Polyangiaceae bacterium]
MEDRGALPFSTLLWQPRPSTWLVTIVCKATFSIEPGEAKLAKTQEPVYEHDAYWDDDSKRSLSTTTDLVPTKPKAEVLVVGHAFAPQGKAVGSLVARVVVDTLDKSVEIVADRSVGPDGTVYQGPRFSRMPLVYERAAGGPQTWNPVGIDPNNRDKFGRAPLPNLAPVGRGDDTMTPFDPIGFGPIAPSWPVREAKLGYRRASFASGQWQNEPLPEGFDLSFFNAAPPDQQLDSIPENASIRLENLHPQHMMLATRLPGVRPRFIVTKRGDVERPKMRPDTLLIDTDRALLVVTWRGHFTVEHQSETYQISLQVDSPRQSWRTVEHAIGPRETRLDALASEQTSSGEELPRADSASTPFERKSAKTLDGRMPTPSAGLPFQSAGLRGRDSMKATNAALPFYGNSSSETTSVAPAPSSNAMPPTPPGLPPLPTTPQTQTAQMASALPFADAAARPDAQAWTGAYPTAASLGVRPPTFGTPPAMPAAQPPASMQPPLAQPRSTGPKTAPPPAASAAPPAPHPAPPPPPRSSPGLATPSYAKGGADPWSGPSSPPAHVAKPAPVMHASSAALAGLVGASNAAADPRASASLSGVAPRKIEGDVLHLLWWSSEVGPRIRRKQEWKKILDRLEQGPFDPDVDEPALADDPGEMEDRREVYEVLAHGAPSSQDGIDRALLDAVRADGRFAAQLLLLVGEARFDFDEVEQLKATISAATPFAPNDEELKKTLEAGTNFLSTPGLVVAPDVATSMTTRIRESFASVSRPVPGTYLDDQTERALLERRAYQKRSVFGEPHLRSLFFFAGSSMGIPTYFPEAVSKKLPLFRRLRVRLIVETHFQADQYESHSAALKVAAVARIVR